MLSLFIACEKCWRVKQTHITERARELFRHYVNNRALSRFFVLLWRHFRFCSGWHGTAHWEASRVTDAWLAQGWVICARNQLCCYNCGNNKEVSWMKYKVTLAVSSLIEVYHRHRIYWGLNVIRMGYKVHMRRRRRPHGVTSWKRANWVSL
jgi:hypothetical protein